MQLRHTILAAALAAAFTAAPASAQAPAGPVREAGFDAAQLSAPRVPEPAAYTPAGTISIDVTQALAAQVQLSKPHLYASAPLSAVMGFAGGAIGYAAGFVLLDCSDEGRSCTHGPDNAEYITAATGLALGAAAGAHLGGRRADSKGSLGYTLLGAAAGALPLVFVNTEGELDAASAVGIVTAPLGAVLADYFIRRPRR